MAREPSPSSEINFEQVFKNEISDIEHRRKIAHNVSDARSASSPEHNGRKEPVTSDLVGLAFSGGGVRSGAMSLGVLQVLHKYKILKYVDYLSTVSGGSYAGAYLTSQALQGPNKNVSESDSLSIAQLENGRQPKRILDFIFSGSYLRDTIGFFNNQLFGMFLILIVAVSGLFCVSSAVAFLFRSLDYPAVRFWADGLGISGDFGLAMLPSILLFFAWVLIWLVTLWRKMDMKSGRTARYAFFVLIISFAVAIAALFGTGDIALSPTIADSDGQETATHFLHSVWALVAGAVFAGLLPYLSPKRLLKSGTDPSNAFEKYGYWFATRALLFGLPFLFVSLMVGENLSGIVDSRDASIQDRPEIREWKKGKTTSPFWDKLKAEGVFQVLDEEPFFTSSEVDTQHSSLASENARSARTSKLTFLDLVNRRMKNSEEFGISQYVLVPATVDTQERNRFDIFDQPTQYSKDLKYPFTSVDHIFRKLEEIHSVRNEIKEENLSWGRGWFLFAGTSFTANRKLLASSEGIKKVVAKTLGDAMKQPRFLECFPISGKTTAKKAWTFDRFPDAPIFQIASDFFQNSRNPQLNGETDYRQQVSQMPEGNEKTLRLRALGINDSINESDSRDYSELVTDDLAVVHRDFLRWYSNQEITRKGHVFSYIALHADQAARLRIFWISLSVFLLSSLLVDLNACSCHRFYKRKLANMWIEKVPGLSNGIPLSQLETKNYGFPYHLISGSLAFSGMFDRSRGYEKKDHFLFSQKYCGSERVGFCPTEDYMDGGVNLDDAVALSGAAVSVMHIKNPLIVLVLFLTNMRLGQWLENPSGNSLFGSVLGRFSRLLPVSPLRLLLNYSRPGETRSFTFVADGGHFENLAINELLKRRNRVILAMDAGADPSYKFEDMIRLARWARMRHGISLVPLDPDQTPAEDIAQLSPKESWLQESHDATAENIRNRWSKKHFVVWRIIYPSDCETEGPSEGLLIYMKSTLTGDEPFELIKYQYDNLEFPHDSTSDQFFDPPRFESYRLLGNHIAESAITELAQLFNSNLALRENETLERMLRSSFEIASPQVAPSINSPVAKKLQKMLRSLAKKTGQARSEVTAQIESLKTELDRESVQLILGKLSSQDWNIRHAARSLLMENRTAVPHLIDIAMGRPKSENVKAGIRAHAIEVLPDAETDPNQLAEVDALLEKLQRDESKLVNLAAKRTRQVISKDDVDIES